MRASCHSWNYTKKKKGKKEIGTYWRFFSKKKKILKKFGQNENKEEIREYDELLIVIEKQ